MAQDRPRYSCIRDKIGTWTVWDAVLDAPAILDGQTLAGRTEIRAQAACSILDRIEAARIQRREFSAPPV